MPMTVLICGSPGSGFEIIGLFANSADAQSYAEDYSLKDCRPNITGGICGKPSGDGFEGPSLTVFCRRRHQPRRPPPAKIRPGAPCPAVWTRNYKCPCQEVRRRRWQQPFVIQWKLPKSLSENIRRDYKVFGA